MDSRNQFAKWVILLSVIGSVFSANILYVSLVASPSHHIWNRQLALALVDRGHNVTMLSHDKEKAPLPRNFTLIVLEGVYELFQDDLDLFEMSSESMKQHYSSANMVYDWQSHVTEHDIKNEALSTLLNYPMDYKFDLIIFDATTSQFFYPVIDRFGRPPVVAVTPFILPHYLSQAMGNHIFTSYSPHFITRYTNKMTFVERFHNLVYTYVDLFTRKYIFLKGEEVTARKRFGDKNVRPLEEYEKEFAVLLCNYNPLTDYGVALPPNIIPVGGLHARIGKKLPDDLQKVMDNAKHGVILFSLGTNIKSKDLKEPIRKSIISAFSRLKQTVIWKFEAEIEGLPNNVIVRKWLPQNDMMAHPKMILFFTHGGALSTQEAMYHGIPVVGVPFLADQVLNLQKMQTRKLGRYLLPLEITESYLYEVISEIIHNPIYLSNTKRLSQLLRDRPQTPLETAVYWVERTAKYGRIDELRLPTSDMCLSQIYNLDIIALALALIILTIFSIIKLIKCFCGIKKCSNKQKVS